MPRFSDIIVRSTVTAFVVSAMSAASAGIDLTPSPSEYVAEGMKHQQLTFVQDKQRIKYELPAGWRYDGGGAQVHLTPPNKKFAEATITAAPLAKPEALDENTIKVLEQQFVAALPLGSQFVKIEEEIPNSVLLSGNPSFEVTASYQLNGEKFLKSALFVDLRDTQLVFRLSARKGDFPALHREFKSSIFSWHWIDSEPGHSAVAKEAEQPAAR